MSEFDYNEPEERSFFQKYGILIVFVVVLLIAAGIGLTAYIFTGKMPPPRKPIEMTVSLPPPPPPPPPPPTPPPPKTPPPEPKMVEQPPIKPNEKPKELSKAPDRAPGPPGKPSGPASDDGIGGSSGSNGSIGGDNGNSGSRFGWYGAKVQDVVHQALNQNNQTRHASFRHLRVRVWIDPTGRVTRTTVSGTTGDPAVDEALKNQAFSNLRLSEPPPSDMPMPVVMTIDEERPR